MDDALHFRAFAAVGDESAALAVKMAFEDRLQKRGGIVYSPPPNRYWKIAGYWEVFFELRPIEHVSQIFEDVLSSFAADWEIHRFDEGGSWAVWNAGPDSTCVIPGVRWMNLECFKRGESAMQETD